MRNLRSVCVFCGASAGRDPAYREAAAALGAEIARRGLTLVFGGGHVGLMGALADAALARGGRVVGVIPEALRDLELAHEGCSELVVTRDMHERKAAMARLSDAFVALPGGWGTMEELFEAVTWAQLGFHDKPVALLDVAGYYRPLRDWIARAEAEGFVHPQQHGLLLVDDDPASLLDALARRELPPVPRWREVLDGDDAG